MLSRLSAVILCATIAGDALPAMAAEEAPRTITVSGIGEMRAAPDEAMLSSGVVTEAHTAADALAANSRAMNEVFNTLKRLGIPEKAIQTSEFSVSPVYQTVKTANGGTVQKISGYEVTNTVSVTVDDLKALGPALDTLVSSGSNQLGNIAFTIRDPKPLLTKAREAAMKDAMEHAQAYARAGGLQIGRILSVAEGGADMPRPMFRMAMSVAQAPAPPPPVAAGEESVSASVNVTFEIK